MRQRLATYTSVQRVKTPVKTLSIGMFTFILHSTHSTFCIFYSTHFTHVGRITYSTCRMPSLVSSLLISTGFHFAHRGGFQEHFEETSKNI